jgi:AbrB family looped-hinge helix DNA binding protein
MYMLHSTLTKKGQTTIPGEVREALKVKPGDTLTYEVSADHVTVRVHPGTRSLMGSLPSNLGKGMTFNAIREAAAKAELAKKRGAGR